MTIVNARTLAANKAHLIPALILSAIPSVGPIVIRTKEGLRHQWWNITEYMQDVLKYPHLFTTLEAREDRLEEIYAGRLHQEAVSMWPVLDKLNVLAAAGAMGKAPGIVTEKDLSSAKVVLWGERYGSSGLDKLANKMGAYVAAYGGNPAMLGTSKEEREKIEDFRAFMRSRGYNAEYQGRVHDEMAFKVSPVEDDPAVTKHYSGSAACTTNNVLSMTRSKVLKGQEAATPLHRILQKLDKLKRSFTNIEKDMTELEGYVRSNYEDFKAAT